MQQLNSTVELLGIVNDFDCQLEGKSYEQKQADRKKDLYDVWHVF